MRLGAPATGPTAKKSAKCGDLSAAAATIAADEATRWSALGC